MIVLLVTYTILEMDIIYINGQEVKLDVIHFRSISLEIDSSELHLLTKLRKLKSASFGLTNLDDKGLKYVVDCKELEYLNLQETEITDQGIAYLSQLKKLKILRLKGCEKISNNCTKSINEIESLLELDLQESPISSEGLVQIKKPNLKQLVVQIWEENFSKEFLLNYSKTVPDCEIIAKGDFYIKNGALL